MNSASSEPPAPVPSEGARPADAPVERPPVADWECAAGRLDEKVAAADRAQEVDLWWGGYSSRAMVPSFLLCMLFTVAVGVGGWVVTRVYDVDDLQARYTVYVLCALAWCLQLGRWAYRVLTHDYRLTTRRLIVERSFLPKPGREVELGHITAVLVVRNPLERRLGVGRIWVRATGPVARLEMAGVHHPGRLAGEIRHLAKCARDAAVATTPGPAPLTAGHAEGDL